MRYVSIAIVSLLLCFTLSAQNQDVFSIVENQVNAFNEGNIEQLVNNVSDDFKWYYIGSDTLILEVSGREEFRKSMEDYFAHMKSVESEIASYSVEGKRISFKEIVTYETAAGKKGSASAMAIYEVKDKLIYRVWYFF